MKQLYILPILLFLVAFPLQAGEKAGVNSSLILAAGKGDIDGVKKALDAGADINAVDLNGFTAIERAAFGGHLDVVKHLVSKGAKLTVGGKIVTTPLHRAAENGRLECIKFLLAKGMKVDVTDSNNRTPLCNSTPKAAKLLIKHGADVNARDEFGWTPIFWSVIGMYPESKIKVLLDAKADLSTKDNDGKTPLFLAVEAASYRGGVTFYVLELLLVNGADVNVKNKAGMAPLDIAEWMNGKKTAELLIKHGAKNMLDKSRPEVALAFAARFGNLKDVEEALDNGAKINSAAVLGRPALMYACRYGHLEVVKMLVKRGAKVDFRISDGTRPVHAAAENGLEKGADLNALAKKNKSVLYTAVESGSIEMVQLVLPKNKHVNTPYEGALKFTPLHQACRRGCLEIARLLLENKADANAKDKISKTPLFWAKLSRNSKLVELIKEYQTKKR
jgi:ankyrin repeat protein